VDDDTPLPPGTPTDGSTSGVFTAAKDGTEYTAGYIDNGFEPQQDGKTIPTWRFEFPGTGLPLENSSWGTFTVSFVLNGTTYVASLQF